MQFIGRSSALTQFTLGALHGLAADGSVQPRTAGRNPSSPSLVSLIALTCIGLSVPATLSAEVHYDSAVPQIAFAAENLHALYAQQPSPNSLSDVMPPQITITVSDDPQRPECYTIQVDDNGEVMVTGTDANGAMYGGLAVADRLHIGLPIVDDEVEPFIAQRGIKFIPWDARSPSYDDTGDSAQQNIETIYDFSFWQSYLDDLARYRYNILSLWSTAPFANLVRLDDYPDAVFEDVYGMKPGLLKPKHPRDLFKSFDTDGNGAIEEADGTIQLIKTMSVDQKMDHWQRVFQYAEDRGIRIFLFSWNVFTHGATGKYGITQEQTNPKTIAYMRTLVRESLLTYPQIAGIGVCSGENDRRELDGTPDSTEHYIYKTYGKAIEDVRTLQPDRQVSFVFRRHGSDLERVQDAFGDYQGGPLYTSVKYAVAHMYSSRRPQEWERRIVEEGWINHFDVFLNLRNDDIFVHRWGNPDYVRDFIRWMPLDHSPGFFMGSDGYVWAREFTSKHPQLRGELEIVKHWFRFRLWGQLAYQNDLDNSYWQAVLAQRFAGVDPALLLKTWTATSEIIPQLNRSVWTATDAGFAGENCMDLFSPQGYLSLAEYQFDRPAMPLSRIENGPDQQCLSVTEWAAALADGSAATLTALTPPQIADQLDQWSDQAAAAVPVMRQQAEAAGTLTPELAETLADIRSMAELGRYYADKMRAAAQLALFYGYQRNDRSQHHQAVAHLRSSAEHWRVYAEGLHARYHTQLMARTFQMDWSATQALIEQEIIEVERAGDFPEISFASLNDGDQFPVGTDLNIQVKVADADGLASVVLTVNGLMVDPTSPGDLSDTSTPASDWTWDASTDPELADLAAGFYQIEVFAEDKHGVESHETIVIRVGDVDNTQRMAWQQRMAQVWMHDGDLWISSKESQPSILMPRLRCTLLLHSDGKMTLRDNHIEAVIWRAHSKAHTKHAFATFIAGQLITYMGQPGDQDAVPLWKSRQPSPEQTGPYTFGITRGKQVVCWSGEGDDREVVWSYRPRRF